MKQTFLIATTVAVTFFVLKFMEMRFVDRENRPLKLLLRDTVIVYGSVLLGLFVLDQISPLLGPQTGGGGGMHVRPPVFTDNPTF